MAEITVRCPDCGSEIEIEEDRAFCFCGECGRKIILPVKSEQEPAVPETDGTEKSAAPAENTEAVKAEALDAETAKESVPAESAPAEAETAPQSEEQEPVKPETAENIPSAPAEKKPEDSKAASAEDTAAKPAPVEKPVPVPKPTGFAAELDRLFREQRYREAYDGYTRYLQSHPGDIRSLYRQGITAVYLSEGNILRTAELRSSVGAAVNAMAKTGDKSLAPEKDEDILSMLLYMTAHGVTFNDKLASPENCASQVNGWIALTGLYLEAAPLVTSEIRREEAFKAGVEFCDRALAFKASYFTGSSEGPDGKIKEEYSAFSPEKKHRKAISEARKRMAESYNALGTRTAEENRLNEDAAATEKNISRLKTDIRHTNEKYKAARKLFLLEKPEVRAARNKILRNSLIIGSIVLLILAVFAFFVIKKERMFFFILLILLAAAFLYVAYSITAKSLIQYESGQYPEGLKLLYDRLVEDKKQLKANRKHASHAKEALNRFNRSKL